MSLKHNQLTQKIPCGVAVSGALLCLQHPAEAAILYTDPADTSITYGGTTAIDLDGDSVTDFTFSITQGGSFSYETRVLGMTGNETFVASSYAKRFFPDGPAIGPGAAPLANNLRMGRDFGFGNFNATVGYMGVQMQKPDGNHFGWLRITTSFVSNSFSLSPSFKVFDYAYNTTPNEPLVAGQTVAVPEPGAALQALAGLAGLGVASLRRRRKTAA